MRYTTSRDGKLRTTVRVGFRLTKDEYAEYNRMAKARGVPDVRQYVENSIRDLLNDLREGYKAAYSEGETE
jgi:hypothetical protein